MSVMFTTGLTFSASKSTHTDMYNDDNDDVSV